MRKLVAELVVDAYCLNVYYTMFCATLYLSNSLFGGWFGRWLFIGWRLRCGRGCIALDFVDDRIVSNDDRIFGPRNPCAFPLRCPAFNWIIFIWWCERRRVRWWWAQSVRCRWTYRCYRKPRNVVREWRFGIVLMDPVVSQKAIVVPKTLTTELAGVFTPTLMAHQSHFAVEYLIAQLASEWQRFVHCVCGVSVKSAFSQLENSVWNLLRWWFC